MIPIYDNNPTRNAPFVTYLLLGVNLLVWLWQVGLTQMGAAWVVPGYGMVPTRVANDPAGEAFTLFTSMFMHGSWAHIGGNMLFLHVFGDNVEDALGHARYLAFYLIGGVCAGLAQLLMDPASTIPMVGASGAIAGVLGAYLVLYPRAPITVINPIFLLWFLFGLFLVLPAWIVVGEWFVWNVLMGFGSLAGTSEGGVAFFAHIGGFVAGLLLIKPLVRGRKLHRSEPWQGFRAPKNTGLRRPRPPGGAWRSGHRWDRWN